MPALASSVTAVLPALDGYASRFANPFSIYYYSAGSVFVTHLWSLSKQSMPLGWPRVLLPCSPRWLSLSPRLKRRPTVQFRHVLIYITLRRMCGPLTVGHDNRGRKKILGIETYVFCPGQLSRRDPTIWVPPYQIRV